MTGVTHAARRDSRDSIALAVILIVLGTGALAANALPNVGSWVVLVLGLALFGAFMVTRGYAFLVPAGIMTGLGTGIVASQNLPMSDEATGGVIVLGLGLGFLSIWVVSGLMAVLEHHPWPLVPGGILAAVGGALLIGGEAVDLLRYWPILLILVGLLVLLRAWRERSVTSPD